MSDEEINWSPDRKSALKALIRKTIDSAGPLKADEIPHLVKARLAGRASGDLDLEDVIREVLEDLER